MKRHIIVFCALIFIVGLVKSQSNITIEFVLYDDMSLDQVSSILDKLEENADRITTHLNVETSDNFRVHVWGDYNSYLNAQLELIGVSYPGSTGWVIGLNDMAIFFNSNAPETAEHEFAHCISLHVKSNFGNNPRWLWESVAIYESNEFNDPNNISYMLQGNYPTISELNGDFNDGNYKIYELGYLITEYILSKWGDDAFINLIKGLGDIEDVLGISVSEFENGWYDFIEIKYFGQTDIPAQNSKDISLIYSDLNKLLKLFFNNNSPIGGTLHIVDLNGKTILNNPICENSLITNLSAFKAGIYIVVIQKGEVYHSEKIVIQ